MGFAFAQPILRPCFSLFAGADRLCRFATIAPKHVSGQMPPSRRRGREHASRPSRSRLVVHDSGVRISMPRARADEIHQSERFSGGQMMTDLPVVAVSTWRATRRSL